MKGPSPAGPLALLALGCASTPAPVAAALRAWLTASTNDPPPVSLDVPGYDFAVVFQQSSAGGAMAVASNVPLGDHRALVGGPVAELTLVRTPIGALRGHLHRDVEGARVAHRRGLERDRRVDGGDVVHATVVRGIRDDPATRDRRAQQRHERCRRGRLHRIAIPHAAVAARYDGHRGTCQ